MLLVHWHKSRNLDVGIFIALQDRGFDNQRAFFLFHKYEPLATEMRRAKSSYGEIADQILYEETHPTHRETFLKEQLAIELIKSFLLFREAELGTQETAKPLTFSDAWSHGYLNGISEAGTRYVVSDSSQAERLVALAIAQHVFGNHATAAIAANKPFKHGEIAGKADFEIFLARKDGRPSISDDGDGEG